MDDGVGEGHHFAEYFGAFVSDPWWSLGCAASFMAIVHLVIARGVQSGIERFSKVMMPMLLLIIGVLVVELILHRLNGCYGLLSVASDDYFSIHVGMILF